MQRKQSWWEPVTKADTEISAEFLTPSIEYQRRGLLYTHPRFSFEAYRQKKLKEYGEAIKRVGQDPSV